MKVNVFWVHSLDKKLFGENFRSNKYVGSIAIMLSALCGAVCGTGAFVGDWLGLSKDTTFWTYAPLSLIPYATVLLETAICSPSKGKGIARALVMLILTAMAYTAGFFAAIAIYCLVALWILFALVRLAFRDRKQADAAGTGTALIDEK